MKKGAVKKFVGLNLENDPDMPVYGDSIKEILDVFQKDLDNDEDGYRVEIYERKCTFKYEVPTAKAAFREVK